MSQVNADDIRELFRDYSIEITPKALQKIGSLNAWLPRGKRVLVTFLSNARLADTLHACDTLTAQGYIAVPHIVARHMHRADELTQALHYVQQNSREALFLAGGGDKINGPFKDTFDFMAQSALVEAKLERYIFAGHPEGNGDIGAQVVAQAEAQKWQWLQQHQLPSALMTQFCFQATPVVAWAQRLRERGLHFPLYLGIPGVASLGSLIKHAQTCGIGVSMGFLLKKRSSMMNLLSLQKPNQLIYDLALARKQGLLPQLARLHFYPLGAFTDTMNWINAIEQGNFTMTEKGFTTHE